MTWLGLLVRWEQAEAVGAVDGGEAVSFTQEADALTITLGKSKGRSLRNVFNSKKRTLHRVIKLTLAPGADIALIPVEGHVAKKQHGTLVNPMGE